MGLLDGPFRRPSQRPDPQAILRALEEFISAPTWADSRRILEHHPELLSEEADTLLGRLAQAQENPQARELAEEHRALLRRCREAGIDAAFGEISPVPVRPGDEGPSVPFAFQADLRRALQAEERYLRGADLHALDEAVAAWERILGHRDFAASEPSFRLTALNDAGGTCLRRYWATGHVENLSLALELWRQGVEQAPTGSPNLPAMLNNLGNGLRERYARTGEPADLEGAIQAYEQSVEQTPRGSPDLLGRLSNLGTGLRDRYARTGELADLEEAIRAYEQAVDQTPLGSPNLPAMLNNLGTGLRDRHARTGELADLEGAIRAYRQSVEQTPPGSPDLPGRLSSLGNGLRDRYARTGELADLEKATRTYEQSVELTPPGSPDLPGYLNNLGSGLSERYAATGELADLEGAIQAYEQAVDQTPPGSPGLPSRLNNLGSGLRDRYARTGELADLERAIWAYEQAVAQAPPGSPNLPATLNNLGTGLRDRYSRTGQLADLEAAIGACEQAVEQIPPGSPNLSATLNNLGTGLMDRYTRTGELADLEKAIRACSQAVQQAPRGSSNLPAVLNNLGSGLRDRYARTGELADLGEAIRAYEQAVEQTPLGSPDLPGYLNNLGNGLRERYARTGELADLNTAIVTWERAWSLLQATFVAAPVAYKLGQQREWSGLCASLVATHLQRAETSLPEATAARRRAMEVAEGSKSRLLAEVLGRRDLPAPPAIPREQADRERELLDALTTLDMAELASHGRPATPQEEAGPVERLRQREQYQQELERIWEAMAQFGPEAADYAALRRGEPLEWDEVADLAADLGADTALLSQFTAADRTLLFVARKGWEEPVVVWANVGGGAWAHMARRFLREVHGHDGTDRRGETWHRPLQPLLEGAAAHLGGVKRIIFAPEGLGHIIPWSVVAWRAGLRGTDGLPPPLVTLPALGLLPRLRRRSASRGSGALVVGNPLGDLEYAEQEARDVAETFEVTPLIGQQATREAVLEHLSDASVVHLATHAGFVPGSPLDSEIVLADGVLTAREVMKHRLQADLLVLSACETGMATSLGGDEMAGLAQAFLQAGARSLVVSLWRVNDPATAALMTTFYAARQAGADKSAALSQAMAEVRARERWSHSHYWGAFVLMGDWA